MTVVSVASFLQAASHPAHGDRRFLMSLAGARGGVIPKTATFTDLQVTQRGAGANMSVDVANGSCFITGTESTYQGVYHGENQGVQNVVVTAADATNARKDLIVARIKDTEYGVAVTDAFSIEAIAGTPAGSPADPTVPENCIVLARVAVAASATSITNANLTDLRNNYAAVTGASVIGNQQKSVAAGGTIPCLSTSRPNIGLYDGLVAYETNLGRLNLYNGTNWLHVANANSKIGCHLYCTLGQVIPGTANTDLNFNAEVYDTDGFHDTAAPNWHKVVIPTGFGGVYAVTGYLTEATASISQIFIKVNNVCMSRVAFNAPLDNVTWTGYLADGDYLTMAAYGTGVTTSPVTTPNADSPYSPSLIVVKVA